METRIEREESIKWKEEERNRRSINFLPSLRVDEVLLKHFLYTHYIYFVVSRLYIIYSLFIIDENDNYDNRCEWG